MCAYVLMKVLESVPKRYDLGIRVLTLGQADRAYDRLAAHIAPGQRVLDIGCGTGALTVRAAQRGAHVVGIDVNAQMLEIAERRVDARLGEVDVELREMGVAELDGEAAESYDVVMSGLCLSELTDGERTFALREAYRLLEPGGLLLLADEVIPQNAIKRLLHWSIRLPLALLTCLLTQTTTRPLKGLQGKGALPEVQATGFAVESMYLTCLGDFIELVARKPRSLDVDDPGRRYE
jgi:demethylmenaquinone methyltransferase/2-methoxy-6-polyprenyl-1,4-benzoquinol methylase